MVFGGGRARLRWFTADGALVLTPEEAAEMAQAEVVREQERNDRLVAKLRELGVEPEDV